MIKIVVDLLGADKPQTELVLGAIRAISENKDLYVYLMGRKAELENFLANVTYDESQLEIVDCTQEITNYDDPVDAYHDKTDSSLIKGLKMCRMNEDIGGFVTCGATGVVLISSILILGKLNATRPALSVVLNGRNDKPFCIVDCGANIDCKADRFVDFARLGVAYMKTLGIENPTVATLSNGIEAGKGSDVIKEAHELLEKCGFNFTGNIEGKEVGSIELNDAVFGVEVNEHLVHMAVVNQLANNRQGTQSAKTRSEVSGGGRKPWRQKGTGHARQGSTRSPQWTGGGVVFAPKPRDYSFKMNKKEKRAALCSALSSKVAESQIIVLDEFKLDEIKTKKFVEVMNNLKASKALVVLEGENKNVVLSGRNIPTVKVTATNEINTYDVLKYETLVVTKAAVEKLEEVYA